MLGCFGPATDEEQSMVEHGTLKGNEKILEVE